MTTPAGSPLVPSNGYLALPIDVDPDVLLADELDTLAATFPGWTAREGHLEVALLEAFSRLAAQTAMVAAQVPPAIFAYIGGLGGVPPLAGAPATCTSTWTMVDTAGYTVPAGTVVAFQRSDGTLVEFTTAGFTVASGSSTATGVVLTDTQTLTADNSLAAQSLVLVDSLAYVASVVSTTPTMGGGDPETQAAYLDRLSQEMQLLAPRPITPSDYAAYSRDTVGVYRALAVDGLIPQTVLTDAVTTSGSTTVSSASATFGPAQVGQAISGTGIPSSTTIVSVTDSTHVVLSAAATASGTGVTVTLARESGQERAITVFPVDQTGQPVSSAVALALQQALAVKREVNFAISIGQPTYTAIDVAWQVAAQTGADKNAVTTAVNTAIGNFLYPGTWAQPQGPPAWAVGDTTVRYLDLAQVVHNTPGVDHIVSLTLCVHGGTPGTADVTLSGDGPLPTAGTVAGTVL